MDQEDFRALLQSAGDAAVVSSKSTSTSTSAKRSRDTAFRPRARDTAFKPRTVNPFKQTSATKRSEPVDQALVERRKGPERHSGDDDALQALRERRKNKEITQAEYLDRLASLETGDVRQAGRARGLDRKLLERVRAGEDVFNNSVTSETRDEDDDAALEAAAAETAAKETTVTEVTSSRNALLASLKMSAKDAPVPTKEAAKFKSIAKRNKDGTTTETIVEDGKKVKLVRDAEGRIIKKLIKKEAPIRPAEKEKSPRLEVLEGDKTVAAKAEQNQTMPIEPFDPDVDIFEDAGRDYDPLSSILAISESTSTINHAPTGPIFADLPDDRAGSTDGLASTNNLTAETIERQFAETLKTAEAKEKERLAAVAKTHHDYGFGLRLARAEDYDGSV